MSYESNQQQDYSGTRHFAWDIQFNSVNLKAVVGFYDNFVYHYAEQNGYRGHFKENIFSKCVALPKCSLKLAKPKEL